MPDDTAGSEVADAIMRTGWRLGPERAFPLVPPVDWRAGDANRSWAFHLHSWDPLGPVLAAHDRDGDGARLAFAAAVALDWAAANPRDGDAAAFAWYDMAVGLRAYRLAYMLDALARDEASDDDDVERLAAAAEDHRAALADEEQFARHSNHGLFQAVGQLAMGRRLVGMPGMAEAAEQAQGRLLALVREHFAADGVHREHSPGYHHTVLGVLQRVVGAGLADDAELLAAVDRIEAALGWFVMPDGALAPFGDTDAGIRPQPPPRGAPPAPEAVVRGFEDGGFAVVRRTAEDVRDSAYLAQICAFHSRTHKHADHLSIVWQEGGRDLLVDAGRYGYVGGTDPDSELGRQGFWYDDPRRVYVESTRAHNTVEIDGRSHARRGVKPFGSALGRHGVADGIAHVESQVRHDAGVVHTRVLLYRPGDWLVVVDALTGPRDGRHDFVQRFHFGRRLELEALGDGFAATIPGDARRLYVVPLLETEPVALVRGQSEPELLGWTSRSIGSMTPVWTAGFAAEGVAQAGFATLLSLGDAYPVVDPEQNRMNVTGRRTQLAWRDGSGRSRLELDREGEALSVRLSGPEPAGGPAR